MIETRVPDGLKLQDLNDSAESLGPINQWVNESTQGLCPELFSTLPSDAKCILANAIVARLKWRAPFDVQSTVDGEFRLSDSESVTVPMMNGIAFGRFATVGGWTIVALPFEGSEEAEIVIAFPDSADGQEATFDHESLFAALARSTPGVIEIGLPRWKISSEPNLTAILQRLGIKDLFSSSADLSGMSTAEGLMIDSTAQRIFFQVDEQGLVAGAATGAVAVPRTSLEAEVIDVDRPFHFFLMDKASRTVWFAGYVQDPRM